MSIFCLSADAEETSCSWVAELDPVHFPMSKLEGEKPFLFAAGSKHTILCGSVHNWCTTVHQPHCTCGEEENTVIYEFKPNYRTTKYSAFKGHIRISSAGPGHAPTQLCTLMHTPSSGHQTPAGATEDVKATKLCPGGMEGTHSPEPGSGLPMEIFKERQAEGGFDK